MGGLRDDTTAADVDLLFLLLVVVSCCDFLETSIFLDADAAACGSVMVFATCAYNRVVSGKMVLVLPCIIVSSSGAGADGSAAASISVPADLISHSVALAVLRSAASILLSDMFAMRGVALLLLRSFFVGVSSCFSSKILSAHNTSFLAFVSALIIEINLLAVVVS